MIADLKKCWARFAETSGLQKNLSEFFKVFQMYPYVH